MRIIAGTLKGRRLTAPSWDGLRPTSDKLRETLFNILAPRVAGARLLDGYAGTGATGLEALSRGARDVVFVERDRRAQRLIADNVARCGISGGYAIIRADIVRALADFRRDIAAGHSAPFDIVVLDPPYADAVDAIVAAAGDLVTPAGIIVVEHARRRAAPATAGRLTRTRDVTSGDSALAFYEPGS